MDRRHLALVLVAGMVGLVQFLPTALLVFVAGHAADRFERDCTLPTHQDETTAR